MRTHAPLFVLAIAACSNGGSTATVVPTARIDNADPLLVAGASVKALFGVADNASIFASQLELYAPDAVAVPGPEGGEVMLALDDRDGNGVLSTGDACTAAFANFGIDGRFLSGVAVLDGITIAGPFDEYQPHTVTGRLRFLGLSIATGNGTFTLTGSLSLRREVRPTVRLLTLVALTDVAYGEVVLRAGTEISRNEYLTDGVSAWADGNRGWFVDGELSVPGVTGMLGVETTVPFTGIPVLPAPYGGTLEMKGQGNRKIVARMRTFAEAMTLGSMRVEVDRDGDRKFDETLTTTWFDL